MTPVARMVVIVTVTLVVAKLLTLAAARAEGTILGRRATAEFFTWMGMRPALFAKQGPADGRGAAMLARSGTRSFALGLALFAVARVLAKSALPAKEVVVSILAMIAMSLILHFGLFDLLAARQRSRGVNAGKLFRAPLAAKSLSEFWSRRWNIGFSEMIAVLVHRPLRKCVSEPVALATSFLVSGLLHELAISVPVRAGYGWPTTYFLLHGALVTIERSMARPPGHAWTLFWLAAPLPLLFHPAFIRGVVWPLAGLH